MSEGEKCSQCGEDAPSDILRENGGVCNKCIPDQGGEEATDNSCPDCGKPGLADPSNCPYCANTGGGGGPQDNRTDIEKAVDNQLDALDAWKQDNPDGSYEDFQAHRQAEKDKAEQERFNEFAKDNPDATMDDFREKEENDKLAALQQDNPDATIDDLRKKEADEKKIADTEGRKYHDWGKQNPNGSREDYENHKQNQFADWQKENPDKSMDDFYKDRAGIEDPKKPDEGDNQGENKPKSDDPNSQYMNDIADDDSSKNAARSALTQGYYDEGDGELAADKQEKAREQGEDPDGANTAGVGQDGDHTDNQHQNIGDGAGKQSHADRVGDKVDALGEQAKNASDAARKGQEQDPRNKMGGESTTGPPAEGWFRWLERSWRKMVSHEKTQQLTKIVDTAVRDGIGTASVGFAYVLAGYPGYMTNTVQALFDILNDLENPLIYSSLIKAVSLATFGIAAPPLGLILAFLMGFAGVFVYSAMEPVAKLRAIIDFVLRFPLLNKLLLELKKAFELAEKAIMKGDSSAFQGLVNGGAAGLVKGAVADAKQNIGNKVDAVKNAPRNAANKIKGGAQSAANAVRNAPRNAASAANRFRAARQNRRGGAPQPA
jgi:hypothetical protein